jgi:hypothetical protein
MKKRKVLLHNITSLIIILSLIIVGISLPVPNRQAHAANFTEASMRLDRMKVSTADNDILIVAKIASTDTEGKVVITFSSGFDVDTTASNITTSTSGLPSTYQGESLTSWPTISATASDVSSQVVTFTSADATPGTLYGFYITAGIDNPGSASGNLTQTIATTTTGDAAIDSSQVAVAILTDDQIVITATVPPTFTFALGANSDSYSSDLSPSSVVSTGGVTVTIGTNAANGWIAWLKSANTSLDSATTSEVIETGGSVDDACTTLSTGSDFYQLDVDITTDHSTGDGTVTIDDEYDCAATTGGTFSATYEEIATASGTTAGDVITLIGRATITAVKSAAEDYTDTWTVIGAGNF